MVNDSGGLAPGAGDSSVMRLSLVRFTTSTNVVLAVRLPSLTVTVIVAEPDCPAAGVTTTVRFPPLPPKTTVAFGASVVFDELPDNVRLPTGVSTSPTTNAS